MYFFLIFDVSIKKCQINLVLVVTDPASNEAKTEP
jgi:hypothetical protein